MHRLCAKTLPPQSRVATYEERPFHNIIGDELPPAEESQAVTAFQISSHPSLSLAGLSMSDYEAKTGESASPEWYDDPEDI